MKRASGKRFIGPRLLQIDAQLNDRRRDKLLADGLERANARIISAQGAVRLQDGDQCIHQSTCLILSGVIQIDQSNGNRTLISCNGGNSGPDFLEPTAVALDRTNQRLLIADDGIRATQTQKFSYR